ncbi:uncharacterized protein [Dermacentor albipictus]|uniref:uncharacterized protein n=1 Tax=Dermacentor albipictus TaxID=60249 RepID=UPI0038FC880A
MKRKARNICEQRRPVAKRQKLNAINRQDAQQEDAAAHTQLRQEPDIPDIIASDKQQAVELEHVCHNLRLPDATLLPSERDSVFFGVCALEGEQVDHILLPKLVKFKSESNQPESLRCSVFLRGQLRSQCTVSSPEEAQSVLDSTHALVLCGGCGMKSEKQGRYISFGGCYFSIKCTYVCESKGPCIHCKYLRKLLQNQLSRKRRNGASESKRLKKHANTRRSLHTAQKKLLNAERDLAAMRQANQQIADEVLSARIKSLPEKQQMALRACFQAATRKSTSGMLYEKEWILECVLLRMRSPKRYEQLRKQKVIILPSRIRDIIEDMLEIGDLDGARHDRLYYSRPAHYAGSYGGACPRKYHVTVQEGRRAATGGATSYPHFGSTRRTLLLASVRLRYHVTGRPS